MDQLLGTCIQGALRARGRVAWFVILYVIQLLDEYGVEHAPTASQRMELLGMHLGVPPR